MHALKLLLEAEPVSTLGWLLWTVLGIFGLAILVGWGTSLSKLNRDEVRIEPKAPVQRSAAKQSKVSPVPAKKRATAKTTRKAK